MRSSRNTLGTLDSGDDARCWGEEGEGEGNYSAAAVSQNQARSCQGPDPEITRFQTSTLTLNPKP